MFNTKILETKLVNDFFKNGKDNRDFVPHKRKSKLNFKDLEKDLKKNIYITAGFQHALNRTQNVNETNGDQR
jgi:hypothetical protein